MTVREAHPSFGGRVVLTGAVELEVAGDVALVVLNRPESLNAVNPELVDGLVTALAGARDHLSRAVVLTGRGRAFCAGHDLRAPRPTGSALRDSLDRLQDVTRLLRSLPAPVIAAVRGHAIGAGAEFVLGCDLVVASHNTRFRFPEVGLGLTVTGGGTRLLPQIAGLPKAKELVLLGEPFGAEDARSVGLVNRVVADEELMPFAFKWAKQLASQPQLASALAKAALTDRSDASLEAVLNSEIADALATTLAAPTLAPNQALAHSRRRNEDS